MTEFYPRNMLIKNNIKIQEQFNSYLIQMIIFQQTQISYSIQKLKTILKNNQEVILETDQEPLLFKSIVNLNNISENVNKSIHLDISRKSIDNKSTDCTFCKKIAAYVDKDMKYYCWFHRSQIEEE